MREKIVGIYKIVSPSGRVYIGQSVDCLHRKATYNGLRCKKQAKLYQSILKYGWEHHSFEIIHKLNINNQDELNRLEEYYGCLYNCYDDKSGLNIKMCGAKGLHSEESKNKIRKARLGYRHSEAAKEKMSSSRTGVLRTVDSRKKQSENLKIGWARRREIGADKHSEKTKANMSLAATERNKNPELIKKVSDAIKNIWVKKRENGTDHWSEETNKKNSESVKKSWEKRKESGEYSDQMKKGWEKLKSNPEYWSEENRRIRSERAKNRFKKNGSTHYAKAV